jgi:hypothetical protein
MITLAEIKTQLTELYLADGYTFDEAHEMISVGEITWKGKKGCIQHPNGKVDQFKITEVVSWVEENIYTDPFIQATEWMTEEQVCAPEIKANNHAPKYATKNGNDVLIFNSTRFDYMPSIGYYTRGRIGEGQIESAADQMPESYSHQVFIDYTNENTNRA